MRDETVLKYLSKIAEAVEPIAAARIASAIVFQNEIISVGIARRKSDPFQKKYARHPSAIYLHGEVSAIKNSLKYLSLKQLSKSKLYVARMKYESSEQNPTPDKMRWGLAKPCSGCTRCIAAFNIRYVCYSTEEGENTYDYL